MKARNNYVIRFDSHQLAESSFIFFPVKAEYHGGYTVMVTGATTGEWDIYKQVIELLRQRKINILITKI